MNREFKALQLSEEEKSNLAQLRAEKRELIQFILAGKTEQQAELSGRFRHWLVATAYATVRPWELPNRPMCHNSENCSEVPVLSEKQEKILEMAKKGLTQNEIAKELKCAQSTVAGALKQVRNIQKRKAIALAEANQTVYQTRIHLFLHGMDLWDAVKGVCLDSPDFARDIDEAISLQMSEVISPHLSYSPQQLDKLIMDIVLATKGRCTVIADSYATNSSLTDTHVVYFIRDCIHTKDIPGGETGSDIPLRCPIIYLDDWIRYLQVPLSENDAVTVNQFNFWRCFYEVEPDDETSNATSAEKSSQV